MVLSTVWEPGLGVETNMNSNQTLLLICHSNINHFNDVLNKHGCDIHEFGGQTKINKHKVTFDIKETDYILNSDFKKICN